MRLHPMLTAGVLAGMTLLLYAFHLSAAPLTLDESVFNSEAQSIRLRAAPLFFPTGADAFQQPVAVYANAAVRAIGGDDISGRIASAIAGAINVALVFLIAHLITGRASIGVIAATILMLTPAHWSIAQLGTDAIFPVPLVLLWLWSSLRFFKWDSRGALPLAAATLGLAVYSHPAGPLTAVFLWLLTLVVARRRNRTRLLVNDAMGNGQFWLVRREAYDRIGGHERVKDRLVEDVAIVRELKRAGARFRLRIGPTLTRTRMYTGWRALWAGLEKNAAITDPAQPVLSIALSVLSLVLTVFAELWPWIVAILALAVGGAWAQPAGSENERSINRRGR